MSLINQISEVLTKKEEHKKKSFWASDSEKDVFDIYHAWIGTTPTNPIGVETQIIFSAGKMMEESLMKKLIDADIAIDEPEQTRIEIERENVPISGYIDGILKDGTPIEIKTYYGDYHERDLVAGKPRTSYLKQLAIYMDAQNKNLGKLIYLSRGTGKIFEFELERVEGTKFKCMSIEFDLEDTYKKWAKLYKNNILPKIEPIPEFRYKYPLDEIDWKNTPKSQITKARNNYAVIGDWQAKYSNFKDLLIKKEESSIGYNDEEIGEIKEMTKGYSTWKKLTN